MAVGAKQQKSTPLCGVLSLIEVGTGFEPV